MDFITDWFLRWWLRTGRYFWSKLRRRLFERRYMNITLPEVNSLGEIEAALKQVTWTKDGPLHLFDSISYPQATWGKKKDDCDGFASLAAELLHRLNRDYRPLLLTALMHPVQASHTVCVFSNNTGKFGVFDNASLHAEEYEAYEAVMLRISAGCQRIVCWDVRKPDTFELVEFHKA